MTAGVAPPRHAVARRGWTPRVVALAGAAAGALAALSLVGFLVAGITSGDVEWGALLTSSTWDPASGSFGAAAMMWGTAAASAIALVIATPLGWSCAIAIHELAPRRARRALRAGVELLATVPSVVYGLVGVALVRPAVAAVAGVPAGDSLAAAGLVLSVMTLPTVVAIGIEALAGVPAQAREAAYALGLTRTEVVWRVAVAAARPGLWAASLLALARALGETIAVFLVVGRADGRLPGLGDAAGALFHPGQTLTTKLGGPELVLAGSSGPHWAAMCALGVVLLASVASTTLVGHALLTRRRTRAAHLRGARSGAARRRRDLAVTAATRAALAVPLLALAAIVSFLVASGSTALDPMFWVGRQVGAAAGGVRDQIAGTLVLVATTAVVAIPVSLGLGLVIAEYAPRRLSSALRTATITLGGVPSILVGISVYALLCIAAGWDKTWLAGALALAILVVPVGALATAARIDSLPPARREAARALGLTDAQVVGSVVVPHAAPGVATGVLLGLARAAGETAPILFTATVFAGAGGVPAALFDAPVVALPTHIFTLAQDAADPAALDAAWGAALVLIALSTVLYVSAIPLRSRMEAAT